MLLVHATQDVKSTALYDVLGRHIDGLSSWRRDVEIESEEHRLLVLGYRPLIRDGLVVDLRPPCADHTRHTDNMQGRLSKHPRMLLHVSGSHGVMPNMDSVASLLSVFDHLVLVPQLSTNTLTGIAQIASSMTSFIQWIGLQVLIPLKADVALEAYLVRLASLADSLLEAAVGARIFSRSFVEPLHDVFLQRNIDAITVSSDDPSSLELFELLDVVMTHLRIHSNLHGT